MNTFDRNWQPVELVQCDGCPSGVLVPADPGLCPRHDINPHAWQADPPGQAYDVAGNL